MGSSCSRCICKNEKNKHLRCVVVGLDGAGKTSMYLFKY